jgi:hypothetical protein
MTVLKTCFLVSNANANSITKFCGLLMFGFTLHKHGHLNKICNPISPGEIEHVVAEFNF